MTGEGTNSYLIIDDDQALVIDPGPAIETHITAILAAMTGIQLVGILLTHMHPDHSPAAQALKAATGASIYGINPDADDTHQDHSVLVDHTLSEGEVIHLRALQIKAILTPGHTSNHICYLLKQEHILFTGDHIMQGSTVVIVPPYGDMQDYLASLIKLKGYAISAIAPGHGEVIAEPLAEVDQLIAHRLKREASVLDAVKQLKESTLEELTALVYSDVHVSLHPLAAKSLMAHLIKLEREAQVVETAKRWALKKNACEGGKLCNNTD